MQSFTPLCVNTRIVDDASAACGTETRYSFLTFGHGVINTLQVEAHDPQTLHVVLEAVPSRWFQVVDADAATPSDQFTPLLRRTFRFKVCPSQTQDRLSVYIVMIEGRRTGRVSTDTDREVKGLFS